MKNEIKPTPLSMVYEYIEALSHDPELKKAEAALDAWEEQHGPEAFPGQHEDYPWWAVIKKNKYWYSLSERHGATENVHAQRRTDWLCKSMRLGLIQDPRSREAMGLLVEHSHGEIDFWDET